MLLAQEKEQQQKRNTLAAELELPNGIKTTTFGSPLRMNGQAADIRLGPPALGAHTHEIRHRYAPKAA